MKKHKKKNKKKKEKKNDNNNTIDSASAQASSVSTATTKASAAEQTSMHRTKHSRHHIYTFQHIRTTHNTRTGPSHNPIYVPR